MQNNNKKRIIGMIVVTVLVTGSLFLLITNRGDKNGTSGDNYVTDFPTQSDSQIDTKDPSVGGTVPVTDVFGDTVRVSNFKTLDSTVTDPVNDGVYILAGDPGFCTGDGVCPKAYATDQFLASYSERDSFFSVLLLQEPVAEARSAATEFMQGRLGVSIEELCRLNASVTVPQWVNEFYAGEELRFKGCPDSVPLE